MPDFLVRIIACADAREPCFTGDEVGERGGRIPACLRETGILRPIQNATQVACDACGTDHVEEVMWLPGEGRRPPRAYISCPENGRVFVPPHRLEQWAPNYGRVAEVLAGLLDLGSDVEELGRDRLWCAGIGSLGGEPREVFLVRGLTWPDAQKQVGGCPRLKAARDPLVLVMGSIPATEIWGDKPLVTVPLRVVIRLENGDQLAVDRDYLDTLFSTGKKKGTRAITRSFPVPDGTTWQQVEISISELDLVITAKGKTRSMSFQEAGFEERRRKGVPNRLWVLLRIFAMQGGSLPMDSHKLNKAVRMNLKQYVADLRRALKSLIPGVVGEGPIDYKGNERSYVTVFGISDKEGVSYFALPGARWEDVTFEVTGADMVQVSVVTPERAVAFADDGELGDRPEAIEREQVVSRKFTLQSCGLIGDRGKPNLEGKALLEIIAGGGVVRKGPDDMGMLGLCSFLSRFMNIPDPPFEYRMPEQKWVALFEAKRGA